MHLVPVKHDFICPGRYGLNSQSWEFSRAADRHKTTARGKRRRRECVVGSGRQCGAVRCGGGGASAKRWKDPEMMSGRGEKERETERRYRGYEEGDGRSDQELDGTRSQRSLSHLLLTPRVPSLASEINARLKFSKVEMPKKKKKILFHTSREEDLCKKERCAFQTPGAEGASAPLFRARCAATVCGVERKTGKHRRQK